MQQVVDQAQLKALIDRYGITQQFEKFFTSWNIEKRYKYSNMDMRTLAQICQKINYKKYNANTPSDMKSGMWMKGQFKLFVWVTAFYTFNLKLSIKQLKRRDYQFLGAIFVNKSIERMNYQLKSLFNSERCPRKRWDADEIQVLKSIIERYLANNKKPQWKSIAFEIFSQSRGENFRTFGQCRQMWNNHLNLKISKNRWLEEQDELLLKQAAENSKKWSKIAQKFGGKRSDHMVKNRYMTLMRRKAKQTQKYSISNEHKQTTTFSSNKLSENFQSMSKILTALDQQQNSYFKHYSQQQEFGGELLGPLEQQFFLNEATSNSNLLMLPNLQHNWCFSSQILHESSLIDYNSVQISKFLNQNNLLEQLGCAHYQQVQSAFQEQAGFSMGTEE